MPSRPRLPILLATALLAGALPAACGGASNAATTATRSTATHTTTAPATTTPAPAQAAHRRRPSDWPRFGFDPARSQHSQIPTGIARGAVAHLRRLDVAVPGTVDSAPIFLHSVRVKGRKRDVFFMTTTYGRTFALDRGGHRLWTYTPASLGGLVGSPQITTAAPVADRAHGVLFAATPDGHIRRLRISDGHEITRGPWPVSVTRDPTHEKITSALNLYGRRLIVTTGGYVGDAPPYQGHVVVIDARTGRMRGVTNSLCSRRHRIITPSSCGASDSAIWGRSGAVVIPGNKHLLVATGNAPFDGRVNWGDSVLELSPDARSILGNYTPRNQSDLNNGDADLGSISPILLPGGLAAQGGKDGLLRLVRPGRLNGTRRASPRLGGALHITQTPGGGPTIKGAGASARLGKRTWMWLATDGATSGYVLSGKRLRQAWTRGTGGTTPILAGGLLWIYDPSGALVVRRPGTGRLVARLGAPSGHWNSPVIAAGRVVLPTGDSNSHSGAGSVSIFRR